ncbi:MAG TPA: HEAT repeat domain-containing protein, partial [Pirellulales bacterium]
LTDASFPTTTRLHAIWGLGQLAANDPKALATVVPLLDDPDMHVRANAVRVLGDRRYQDALQPLIARLQDGDSQVRLLAAVALGKLGDKTAFGPLVEMIRANTSDDPWLRHGGVMGLLGMNDVDAVLKLATDASPVVRISALLVLRRLADPRVALFLNDADLRIVTEAARAIQNVPIEAADSDLAKLAGKFAAASAVLPDALSRRILYANFRLGAEDNARALVALASGPALSPAVRAEAIAELSEWSAPSPRDRVNGAWRALPPRDPSIVKAAVSEAVPALLSAAPADLQGKVVDLITKVGAPADDATFLAWVQDENRPDSARVAAFRLLATRYKNDPKRESVPENDPRLVALSAALESKSPALRSAAWDVSADFTPEMVLPELKSMLLDAKVTSIERQAALATLARLGSPEADAIIAEQLGRLAKGKAAEDIRLDIYEAAQKRATPTMKETLAEIDAGASAAGPNATGMKPAEAFTLVGGDAEKGRAAFVGHLSAQCLRCHKIGTVGGDAGPALTDVGKRLTREELRQSLLDPSAKIAKGFESVSLTLVDGRVVAGVIKEETPEKLTLTTPDGKTLSIDPQDVEDRSKAVSLMPAMGQHLTPREVRDLIEYLSEQGRQ